MHGHSHAPFRYPRLMPEFWRSAVNRHVVEMIAPRAGEQAVDLGAGMGAATTLAARSGATVIAVDPTPFGAGGSRG
jgi:predicted RNA methylase